MKRRVSSGSELAVLQHDVEELLDLLTASAQAPPSGWSPPVDVAELRESFVVRVDVPGTPREALHVRLLGRRLQVGGSKPAQRAEGRRRRCHRMERGFGAFSVEVILPGPVRSEAATATLRAGVLTVVLPRVEDRRGRAHAVPIAEEEP